MKKILLLILIIFITLLSACGNEVDPPTTNNKTEVKEEFSRVIASSDFQGERGHLNSEENLLEVMAMIEEDGIDSADAFFACGDYDYEFNDSRNGIELFKNAMEYYVNRDNMYFVQGNHDELVPGEDGLNPGGDNDPKDDKFGVFIINEDEYMWYNNNEAIVKNLGYNLQKYLNEKLEENYTKPIFILSHLGLNYNMRTYNDGDGQYAKYIFDVLNEAGEKGLNIIYLFGHNHSNGWDDYLGGASIYLAKGDDILIADNDKYKFSSHKLNFTYMNAGYIGYYRDVNEGADTSLTMTVFDIYSDRIVINRYSKDGKHNLNYAKIKGAKIKRVIKVDDEVYDLYAVKQGFIYVTDIKDGSSGTLYITKGPEAKKIDDDVSSVRSNIKVSNNGKKIYYLKDFEETSGNLYVSSGREGKKIVKNVCSYEYANDDLIYYVSNCSMVNNVNYPGDLYKYDGKSTKLATDITAPIATMRDSYSDK
jgi:hypothetical protein